MSYICLRVRSESVTFLRRRGDWLGFRTEVNTFESRRDGYLGWVACILCGVCFRWILAEIVFGTNRTETPFATILA